MQSDKEPRGFNANDLREAQWDKIQKRLNRDPELRKRWSGVVADFVLAEKNLDKLKSTLREIFRDGAGDALLLLRRDAETSIDSTVKHPPLIPNPHRNRIAGNEIDSRRAN